MVAVTIAGSRQPATVKAASRAAAQLTNSSRATNHDRLGHGRGGVGWAGGRWVMGGGWWAVGGGL